MTMKAYLYNKCDTCRKAKKWLTDHKVSFEEVPIVDAPPSKEELRRIWQTSGLDLRKFFNVSGVQYRELGLKDKLPTMTEEEVLRPRMRVVLVLRNQIMTQLLLRRVRSQLVPELQEHFGEVRHHEVDHKVPRMKKAKKAKIAGHTSKT